MRRHRSTHAARARLKAPSARRPRRLAAAALALALATLPGSLSAQSLANDEAELEAARSYWQDRYRGLLTEASELRATIERERELYADANRRNYRRGRKRHIHRDAMLEAQDELARVESQLATIQEEARRAGALPGWFYEVEWQLEEEAGRPAISSGPGDEGRNPLHLDDDDEDQRPADG